MGILFNVLDSRMYGTPGQSYIDTLHMDKYDYNTIPEEDCSKFVYARGVSLELIEWLNSKWILTCVEGNPQEQLDMEDLQVQLITRQGLSMLQYMNKWTEEQNEKDSLYFTNINPDVLQKQLEWAMHTIPWMESSWSDTLKEDAESFYLDTIYPASGQPLLWEEMLPYLQWSEKIFQFIIIEFINILMF